MGTKESLTPVNHEHEAEGNRTPAVLEETYQEQADTSKWRLSRLGKSVIAATVASIAALGSGLGLVLSAGGEKTVKGTEVVNPPHIPPQVINSDPSYFKPVTEHTTTIVHTTNGLEHGLGWGLIGAGAGLTALALWGAGTLINRHMQNKNSNRN